MRYYGKSPQYIISMIVVFTGLKYISPKAGPVLFLIFLSIIIPLMILRKIITNYLYKCSINIVPKQYVLNFNTIQNKQCTVQYTPNQKIVVMDNIAGVREEKRIFTVYKNKTNINEIWNKICKLFDNFTSLDSLVTFFNYSCNINVDIKILSRTVKKKEINIIKKEAPKAGFVDINQIDADKLHLGETQGHKGTAEYIDFENMNKQKIYTEKPQEKTETFEISDIATKFDRKIDINKAEASEIAILPGINIAMAKRLVDARNLNGYFKTADDFIAAANVKEHFVQQIKSMIIVSNPNLEKSNDNDDFGEGRVVDL